MLAEKLFRVHDMTILQYLPARREWKILCTGGPHPQYEQAVTFISISEYSLRSFGTVNALKVCCKATGQLH